MRRMGLMYGYRGSFGHFQAGPPERRSLVPVVLAILKSKLAKQIAVAVLLEVVAAIATKPKGKR